MSRLRKLIILDDDVHFSGLLALRIRQRFPEVAVSSFDKSEVMPGYDIYILDNDFGGEKQGARLAEEVRARSPESLVIMLSATLEMDLLKRLVNCHAAGVFDKSDAGDLERMMQLMEQYLLATPAAAADVSRSGEGAVASITKLIAEWNRRLSFEERA